MQGDKKKIIVVGVLALVIVSVGAFQFMNMGSSAPAPAPAKKEEKKSVVVEADKEEPKNPLFIKPLAMRDPFEPPASAQPKQPEVARTNTNQAAPSTMGGKLPPVEIGGGMPSVSDGNKPVIMPAPTFQFTYTVNGVMLGAKPLAIFADAQGNQRIVPLGGSIDADTTVIDIEKLAVTIRFHGKTLRLTVEGNPNDK